MQVLVAYSPRDGATRDIAHRLAATLTLNGCTAVCRDVAEVSDLDSYDAVVIGSALSLSHWRHAATRFVHHNRAVLASKPVCLFSSGRSGGAEPRLTAIPRELAQLMNETRACDHHVFRDAINGGAAGTLRGVITRLRGGGPRVDGALRDRDDIDAWAERIARRLKARSRDSARSGGTAHAAA